MLIFPATEKGEVKVKYKAPTEKEFKPPEVEWIDQQVALGWPRAAAEAQWAKDHPKPQQAVTQPQPKVKKPKPIGGTK